MFFMPAGIEVLLLAISMKLLVDFVYCSAWHFCEINDLCVCMVGVASIVDALISVYPNGELGTAALFGCILVSIGVGGDSLRELEAKLVQRGGVQEAELTEFYSLAHWLPLREGVGDPPSS